jgi:signal transduction histidine kinase
MTKKEVDKSKILERVYDQNINLLFYVSIVTIPVAIGHVLFFYFKFLNPEPIVNQWRMGIIYSHLSVLIVSMLIGAIALMYRKTGSPKMQIGSILIQLFYIFILLIGVVIVTIDQLVTPSITPFLLVCSILAIVFIVNPLKSFLFFLAGYALFYFALAITQENPEILLSNRLNGLSIVAFGFLLSLMIWKNTIQKFRQSIIIENQGEYLSQKNMELVEQSDELKNALLTKDKLFSVIGHDLKSPLAAINGLVGLLEESLRKEDNDKTQRIASAVKSASGQTMELLDSLMEWSRFQSQGKGLNIENISIDKLVNECLSLIEANAANKEIDIITQLDAKNILADSNLIKTVIRNLLANAVKFSYKNSTVQIIVKDKGDSFYFAVKDEGIGLDDNQKHTIFLGDSKNVRKGTLDEKGTGLGLVICRDFIKMHGGKIGVESNLGKGSIFWFSIPKL